MTASSIDFELISSDEDIEKNKDVFEKDFYGGYCLKFKASKKLRLTEDQVYGDFRKFGELMDIWMAGVDRGDFETEVYVRFINRRDADDALDNLKEFYDDLKPSVSDILPDNHGLYTILFENKSAVLAKDLYKEFSKFGTVKSVTGALNVRMGRVFIAFLHKEDALQAFLNKTDKCFVNMRFALPKCEKDYFDTYCLKLYNSKESKFYSTEAQISEDFRKYGKVLDIRGPGLFDCAGDDVYIRYREKISAQSALYFLACRYDSLCITPPSDFEPDTNGRYVVTFVNERNISRDEAVDIFSKFGPILSMTGGFGGTKGRVFVYYEKKEEAQLALRTMLPSKEFHLRIAKSCKPTNYPKSANNYYSVAGANNSMEFPIKRKYEDHYESEEKSKRYSYKDRYQRQPYSPKENHYSNRRSEGSSKSYHKERIRYNYRAPYDRKDSF